MMRDYRRGAHVYDCSGSNNLLLWKQALRPKRAASPQVSWWQMIVAAWEKLWA